MTSLSSRRRTPLGLAYASDPSAGVDWSATAGEGVHLLAGGPARSSLRLFDLTRADRFGVKGRGASGWLARQGLEIPERVNTALASPDRRLDVMRLGQEDFVALSRPGEPSGSPAALRALWSADAERPKGYDGWREEVWAWFHVCGEDVAELMAMTCPVDLRPHAFARGAIAQTRVAQMDCVVLRSDRAGTSGFDLFFDVASCAFALESFIDLAAG